MASNGSNNTKVLQELEALSDSLFPPKTTRRRTASFSLPRPEMIPSIHSTDGTTANNKDEEGAPNRRPRTRRISLSLNSWSSSRTDHNKENEKNKAWGVQVGDTKLPDEAFEKKGIWKWKPFRALTHLGKQKLSCLFSVEVVAIRGLPATMNGVRLAVCVRKKDSKDGLVQTMPSKVSRGDAEFEETLFLRCHVYFTPGSGTLIKFEPRPFLIYAVAVDAEELDCGRTYVDLSSLIQESIERGFEGTRIRQWDRSFALSGKAKGGELVLKLGFQIMEKDGATGIYAQAEQQKLGRSESYSPFVARTQSKSSFSIPSSRISRRSQSWIPSQKGVASDDHELELDENDFPDFDVVEKGVEIEDKHKDKRSATGEVVKEVVQDQSHLSRLKELDSIAQQIKALESVVDGGKDFKTDEETGSPVLDAEEDKVTREFLQMLDDPQNEKEFKSSIDDEDIKQKLRGGKDEEEVFVPDLGKGLGCVVQTRNGGYLAAVNPLATLVMRNDTPKLAMQMSKALMVQSNKTAFNLLQRMAALGFEELTSEVSALMPMDELMGKTAEQIAFEAIASAIIQGRNKEGASSSAARIIAAAKFMATGMNNGRKERVSTGIWNVSEEPLKLDEILASSMPKIETMAIDGLKIQADAAEEAAPFDASPIDAKTTGGNGKLYSRPLASAIPIEDWINANSAKRGLDSECITVSLVIQLRDPSREYEPVGGPMMVLIHATKTVSGKPNGETEEKRYKVTSLQVGGVKVKTIRKKNIWDAEKQKLSALQWVVANGMGKAEKKVKVHVPTGPDVLWSISSRVVADTWLKPTRNPDVKFTK